MSTLLLVLVLTLPSPAAGSAREKALAYLAEGKKAFASERFEPALRSFEMAVLMGRFTLDPEDLGEAFAFQALAAVRAGDSSQAVAHARASLEWARRRGRPLERARARLTLAEAWLLGGAREEAEEQWKLAGTDLAETSDPGELERHAAIGGRLGAGPATPAPARGPEPRIEDRVASSVRLPPQPTPQPLVPAPSPSPLFVPIRPAASPPPPALIPGGEVDLVVAGSRRRIEVRPFLLDRHEVTGEEYAGFAARAAHAAGRGWRQWATAGREREPVRGVSAEEAAAYCQWAGKRLPSEAEWLRAASGREGRAYAYGKRFDPAAGRSAAPGAGPLPVDSFAPNPFGVHDLTGNVAEWCTTGETGPAWAVLRGGSFASDAEGSRNAAREPGETLPGTAGVRCAADARPRRP